MKKHEFDPLSLIFGLLFILGGVPLLVSKSGFEFLDGRWVFPTFLIAAGVIVLITAQFSRNDESDDSEDPFSHQDSMSG